MGWSLREGKSLRKRDGYDEWWQRLRPGCAPVRAARVFGGLAAGDRAMRIFCSGVMGVVGVVAACASAETTYDNWNSWDGNVTSRWFMQAQKFPVPAVDNILDSWQSQFDSAMIGLPVNFSIMDIVGGVPGGSTYFSSGAVVPGSGTISFTSMNVVLNSGQEYAAVWDFLGYSGPSIHFTGIDVVPGNGQWWNGSWNDNPTLDQRLIASFVGGCVADCDGSGALNIFDFLCFQSAFGNGGPEADCDGNGVLNIFDFLCFQSAFGNGC